MSSNQDQSARVPPSVEISQKYMSWHMKEMNESLKDLCNIFRSIDLTLKGISTKSLDSVAKIAPRKSTTEEIPF